MTTPTEAVKPIPRLWPYLLLCLLVGAWINLGSFHRLQHSDSLVPVLTSLYEYRLFYWGWSRIGQLLPLLAMPVTHPLWNLLVQSFLGISAGLAFIFLLARYTCADRCWPILATVTCAGFLLLFPPGSRFNFLVGYQPYGVGLSLCLGGLLCLELSASSPPGVLRWIVAGMLVLLGHWVFAGAALFLGPLVILRTLACWAHPATEERVPWYRRCWHVLIDPNRYRSGQVLCLLAGCTVAVYVLMQLVPSPKLTTKLTPVHQYLPAWRNMLSAVWVDLEPYGYMWYLFLTVLLGFLGFCVAPIRRRTRFLFRSSGVLTGAALIYAAITLAFAHIAVRKICDHRYWWIALIAVLMAGTLVSMTWLRSWRSLSWDWLRLASGPFLLVIATVTFGFPSLAGVRRDLDLATGQFSNDILAARATHVAGDYWDVWRAVFHANLLLYEEGADYRVWGITYLGEVTRKSWNQLPLHQRRYALLGKYAKRPAPPFAEWAWLGCPLPELQRIAAYPTLVVYRVPVNRPIPFEVARDFLHQTGQAKGDAWVNRPGLHPPGNTAYGAFLTLPAGWYAFTAYLQASQLPPPSEPILTLNVVNVQTNRLLASQVVRSSAFRSPDGEYRLRFAFKILGWNNMISMAFFWHGNAALALDKVLLQPMDSAGGCWHWEGRELHHQLGQQEGKGWTADPARDSAGFLSFGPYAALPPGRYEATFQLQGQVDATSEAPVARVDVCEATSGAILGQRHLLGLDWHKDSTDLDVPLEFLLPQGAESVEFRVFWHGNHLLSHQGVTLRTLGNEGQAPPLSTTDQRR